VHKILVTGASGFIGRALVARLRASRFTVLTMDLEDGDISANGTLAKFMQLDIEHVFHLAGKTFVPDSWGNPQSFYETNVMGTLNVLEFCRAKMVPLTYVSAYVYGHPEKLPISEDSAIRPNNPYAHTKRIAEQTCNFYANAYGLPVTVIRPFNVYGIGQSERFLIPTIIRQVMNIEDRIVVKDLLPKRDYVYLEDLVKALLATLKNFIGYRVYNIGSGESINVQQVIDFIQNAARKKKKIFCENVIRPSELMDVVADISRARDELGWFPEYSFQLGIESILKSMQESKYR
jgi:GDP-4-dehydro-6-deoxy-D-mannose reductase